MKTTADRIQESQIARKRALVLWGVLTTSCSLVPTAYAAYISNSTVLLADFLRCSAEFFAILTSWLVLRKIAHEDEATLNFGFGKLEQVASLVVAAALFFTFLIAFVTGLERLLFPVPLQGTEFGFGFAVLSVGGNIFLWLKNRIFNSKYPSPLIAAQSRLFLAKTLATLVVATSLGISLVFKSHSWTVLLDPIGSLLLAVFLLVSAYQMLESSMPDLVDRAVEEKIQLIILATLIRKEGLYSGLERIRTRRSGNRIYLDIFLSFHGDQSFSEVASRSEELRTELAVDLPGTDITVVPSLYG